MGGDGRCPADSPGRSRRRRTPRDRLVQAHGCPRGTVTALLYLPAAVAAPAVHVAAAGDVHRRQHVAERDHHVVLHAAIDIHSHTPSTAPLPPVAYVPDALARYVVVVLHIIR